MGLSDRLKDLRSKAEDAVVEHKDQIRQTVAKVGEVADQRTGGKYSEKIQKAGGKASGFVESLDKDAKDPEATVPVGDPSVPPGAADAAVPTDAAGA